MKTTETDISSATAWARYQRMRVQLSSRINRELSRETGLSEADYEILTALTTMPEGPVRVLALRCGLEWEKSRLSHQLRRMEQRGLIVRETCAEDNRSAELRVTPAGARVVREAREQYERLVRRYVTDVLTVAQLTQLGEISDAVLARIEEPHPG